MNVQKWMRCFGLLFFLFASGSAHAITQISMQAAQVTHPQGEAKDVNLVLDLKTATPQLQFRSNIKQSKDKYWGQLHLNCQLPSTIQTGRWHCAQGLFKNARANLPFSLEINQLFNHQALDINAELKLNQASFSDEAGLHAAEKLSATMNFSLKPLGNTWQWRTLLDWQEGEVYWQPFYLASAGYQLTANGSLDNDTLKVDSAHLKMQKFGEFSFNGALRLADFSLVNFNGDLPNLDLAKAFPVLFKPLLEKTAFSHAEIAGEVGLTLAMEKSELKTLHLQLRNVDIVDQHKKFAFYQVNADVPWSYDEAKQVTLNYQRGELLNMPLGKTHITAEVNRYAFTAPNIQLPILDGALNLSDISAARLGDQWYGHLRAILTPISMADFSNSLHLPQMTGQASAEIPLVTYSDGVLTTDGSLILNVFNGTATVTELKLQKPLGNTPKLNANIVLRNLDLGNLTRTFSFGAIEGKLDGDIKALEMQNWKPVKFDAVVQSSPGKYPKKISQRAVENISALGGAGAAAAIQRSVLRFFEQFNYEKLGLSCQLRNDICKMSGIASTPQGYIIVKGSGIPAITVMGYNQTVGWGDLVGRIQRVIDGNTKVIVK
jgi:hypothetical protein